VVQAIVDALQSKVVSESAQQRAFGCMRMVANVWALLQSLDTLDAWTLAQARPQQQAGAGGGGPEGAADANASGDAATGGRAVR
jgi:hypothetical protein